MTGLTWHRTGAAVVVLLLATGALPDGGNAKPASYSSDGRLQAAHTAPMHSRTLPYDPDPPRKLARPLPEDRHYDRIAYVLDQPAAQRLTLSRDLSTACRRGEFNQRIEYKYRGFGPGERPMGVAFGAGGINLVDPKQRRTNTQVYFFGHNAGQCLVYVGELADLRPFLIQP
jgi:hypothetical protein